MVDVHLLHPGGAAAILAISINKDHPDQPRDVMAAAWEAAPALGKITVVVDGDIDIRSEAKLLWAMSWTVQPERDIRIQGGTEPVSLDPSQRSAPTVGGERNLSSKAGIDATRKHDYPPPSGPPAEHRARVLERWAEYGVD